MLPRIESNELVQRLKSKAMLLEAATSIFVSEGHVQITRRTTKHQPRLLSRLACSGDFERLPGFNSTCHRLPVTTPLLPELEEEHQRLPFGRIGVCPMDPDLDLSKRGNSHGRVRALTTKARSRKPLRRWRSRTNRDNSRKQTRNCMRPGPGTCPSSR